MKYLLDLGDGFSVECRDARQAEQLASLFMALTNHASTNVLELFAIRDRIRRLAGVHL